MNERKNKSLNSILLVEDEEDHVRLIKKALKEHGRLLNDIYWVKNGKEAMQYINRTDKYNEKNAPLPGLILLDIKLPLMDGFEVLKKLKSSKKYRTIPVVMLTTASAKEDIRKALELGANDYIIKPVKFSDFAKKVCKLGYYWAFVSDSEAGVFIKMR